MNKTILLGLAIAASVSSASAYHADKYDGQFGMSLEGAYGIATKDAMPNVAGGNLSIFNYIETGSIVHQISLNGGILAGSHHPSVQDLGISGPYTASLRSTYIPMMAGYTLNLPIGDYTMFYLGGKAGATYGDVKTTIHGLEDGSRSRTISSTKFSWAAQAGFKFSISNSADFVLGYEYYQIQGYNDPGYHTIKLGFSWEFLTNNYQIYYCLPAAPLHYGAAFCAWNTGPHNSRKQRDGKLIRIFKPERLLSGQRRTVSSGMSGRNKTAPHPGGSGPEKFNNSENLTWQA